MGVGFVVEGSFPFFGTVALAQVLWGFGYTFTSGATQAWITDEIGETRANQAFLRSNQIGQIAALAGIGAGALIGSLQINLPIQVGGILILLLGLLLILIMPETGFHPTPRGKRNSWQHMVDTFRGGVAMLRKRPALIDILVIGLFYGLYSEGFDRLWTKLVLDNFTFPAIFNFQPVVWMSGMRAAGMLLSIGASEIALRRVNTASHTGVARALMSITLVLIFSLLGFAMAPQLAWVIIAYLIIYVTRNVIGPLYTAWVNQGLDSQVRATVISMSSQVDAIGQIAGGPIVGIIANIFSVNTAIVVSALTLTPILPLFSRTIRRETRPTPVEAEPIDGK
jgi:DHA3 family tetracycline resistance protein-like MFS transporter